MSKLKEQKEENKKAREERENKLREAMTVFVSVFTQGSDYNRWNTTTVEATITKILICLQTYKHNIEEGSRSWIRPFYEAIFFDFSQRKPDSKQYVENFYNAVMRLEETMRKDGWSYVNNAIDDNNVDVLLMFIEVCKSNFAGHRYNWDNYDFIKSKIGLSYGLLSDFGTSFRGTIQEYHNINDKYKIVETKKFNDDKDVMAWEKCFYNIGVNSNYVYSTFDDALIALMFGRFNSAAYVLFERAEEERKEKEEQEKEKQLKKSLTDK